MEGTYPMRLSYTRYICKNFEAVRILHHRTLTEKALPHKNVNEK